LGVLPFGYYAVKRRKVAPRAEALERKLSA